MGDLQAGLSARVQLTVTEAMLASRVGSGLVDVFSTPELVRLLEQTAVTSLRGALPAGQTSVGSTIQIAHLAPTPAGMQITATATLTAVEGRKLSFDVSACDEVELIAQGTHQRYVVDEARFRQKAQAKKAQT